MRVYPFSVFLTFTLGLLVLALSLPLWGFFFVSDMRQAKSAQKFVAGRFLLTDFCLSTESRHVRHFAMPEWIAPFQDYPAYLEHFPASSFFMPIPLQPNEKSQKQENK
ncbi:hypothetical protein [Hugenholtzia roseola]|uniref:hypothetical protein n=1 Tax=Hugenholtzia roseola TaxID=1002 RepID=UPI0003F875B2|nr:hypothetical protein [Hugenholtzia roseola]